MVERTFSIIKPDAVAAGKAGAILSRLEQAGFTLVAVRMRRLPAEHMLDARIRAGRLEEPELRPVALRLADFYRHAEPVPIEVGVYRAQFADAIELNRHELTRPEHELPDESIATAHAALTGFLERDAALLDARVVAGRIVEGQLIELYPRYSGRVKLQIIPDMAANDLIAHVSSLPDDHLVLLTVYQQDQSGAYIDFFEVPGEMSLLEVRRTTVGDGAQAASR